MYRDCNTALEEYYIYLTRSRIFIPDITYGCIGGDYHTAFEDYFNYLQTISLGPIPFDIVGQERRYASLWNHRRFHLNML